MTDPCGAVAIDRTATAVIEIVSALIGIVRARLWTTAVAVMADTGRAATGYGAAAVVRKIASALVGIVQTRLGRAALSLMTHAGRAATGQGAATVIGDIVAARARDAGSRVATIVVIADIRCTRIVVAARPLDAAGTTVDEASVAFTAQSFEIARGIGRA